MIVIDQVRVIVVIDGVIVVVCVFGWDVKEYFSELDVQIVVIGVIQCVNDFK